MLKRKTFNPYRQKTAEIVKFRGITDSDEKQNSAPEYVGSSSNLESFKLRFLEPRTGQSRDLEYLRGAVRQGKSMIVSRCHCVGKEIWVEQKTEEFLATPFAYPWRYIYGWRTPNIPPLPNIRVQCQDLTVPVGYPPIVSGREENYVTEGDWMSCFRLTCNSFWTLIGDLEGWEEIDNNADLEVELIDAFKGCYKEKAPVLPPPPGGEEGGGVPPWTPPDLPPFVPPPLPPFPPLPEFEPPPFPEYERTSPAFDLPDLRPDQCYNELFGFNNLGDTEKHLYLEEGYTVETFSFFFVAGYTSRTNGSEIGAKAEATNAIGGDPLYRIDLRSNLRPSYRKLNWFKRSKMANPFSCSRTEYAIVDFELTEGFPAGTIIRGNLRMLCFSEQFHIPFTIWIGQFVFNIPVSATGLYTELEKEKTTGGASPTLNASLSEFRSLAYTETSGSTAGDTFRNKTLYYGHQDAVHIMLANRTTFTEIYQDIIFPTPVGTPAGARFNGKVVGRIKRTKQNDGIKTDAYISHVPPASGFKPWCASFVVVPYENAGTNGCVSYFVNTIEENFVFEFSGIEAGDPLHIEIPSPYETTPLPSSGLDPNNGKTSDDIWDQIEILEMTLIIDDYD